MDGERVLDNWEAGTPAWGSLVECIGGLQGVCVGVKKNVSVGSCLEEGNAGARGCPSLSPGLRGKEGGCRMQPQPPVEHSVQNSANPQR